MRGADFLTLSQWLSPAYPVGSFVFSQGLERAVADGLVCDAATLEAWLRDSLAMGSLRNDAILLACAARPEADLAALSELATALTPAAERRAEARALGAAFAATTRAVWELDLPDAPYPVAVGRASGLAGLPTGPVLQLYLQAGTSSQVQAALRLMPLGQTAGARVLAALAPDCLALAQEAEGADTEDLGSCTLAADIAMMRHETLGSRIFRS
ncbi:urease accessory protein UreF [Pseudoroseicyclus aestuarii]|uniref:Urease accessory protein UreF n=1 Tax=Pseudoroseicyclus aestuarii TaxID=1795041 RepID=A0A318SRW5_9RHOB|nr:urease accessory UreF family protein [Pseudoroseicyclus aestuarii]PYE84095.1 urease accessory protein [Pseudoroseicyclus aestuarii]